MVAETTRSTSQPHINGPSWLNGSGPICASTAAEMETSASVTGAAKGHSLGSATINAVAIAALAAIDTQSMEGEVDGIEDGLDKAGVETQSRPFRPKEG
jgi:hypothetical protein